MAPLLVTAAILELDGKILITRRMDGSRFAGLWEFPGGKLEAGESPQEALLREIREELGVAIVVGPIYEVVHHRYAWGAILLLAYHCRPLELELRNLGVAEHRWIAPAELAGFEFLPADRPIVTRLQGGGGVCPVCTLSGKLPAVFPPPAGGQE